MKWPYIKLVDATNFGPQYGANAAAVAQTGNRPRYIRITDINENGRLFSNGTVEAELKDDSKFILKEGDLLFARSGNTVGKTYHYKETDGPCTFAGYLIRFRMNLKLMDSRFAFYFTQSSFYKLWVASKRRVAGQPNINGTEYSSLHFPMPPITEQRRIVEILDQADRLRTLRADADAKARRILPVLFIKMFGDPVTNPMGWKVGTLGDVCERITDGTHQPPPFVENGIPFLFVQNIVKGVINFNTQKFITKETYESLTRTIAPQKGDILYSTVGSYGVAVVVDTNRLFLFQRHIGHLRPKGALMDSWFLCAQMNTPYMKAQADQRARGLAQKTLNLSEIRQFQVVTPPLVEQKKFRLAMQNLEKITGRVNYQEILIESLFRIILHRAFTGDLTTSWREAHMKELLQEMEIQAKALAS